MGGGRRLALLVLLLAAASGAAYALRLDRRALEMAEVFRGAGLAGALAFGAAYALATIAMVPGSLLTLAAGFLYGPWYGTLLVSPASLAGAAGAYGLGRTAARSWVAGRIARYPVLAAADSALGRRALLMVALLR
ncbi:MAG: VTT domain-containing protein, partial [Planctomycetales bacterium]|nr:VTT domain-containing protein [Planctomycetales bacterium]